jgi:hypothetical protein
MSIVRHCSHIWKDQRFIHQFVFNWPVSIWIDPACPVDGKPRKHMQYGQTYECQNCHLVLQPNRAAETPRADRREVQHSNQQAQ